MGQKHTLVPTRVETTDELGNKVECTTKETVDATIHEEVSPIFIQANNVSMYNGHLFGILGYNADTEAGAQIQIGLFVSSLRTDPDTLISLQ